MYDYNLQNNVILEMTKDQNTPNKRKEARRLVEKWKKTKLLENLSPEKQENLAFLLENEAKELRGKILSEQTSVGDIAGFNKIAFPLVRRVFAQLLTNDIVSVQPMQMPSGLVFFLDFVYERTKAGVTAGDSVYGKRTPPISGKAGGIGAQKGQGSWYGYQGALGYGSRMYLVASARPTLSTLTAVSYAISGTLSGYTYTLDTPGSVDTLARYAFRPCLSGELNAETGTFAAFRSLTAIKSLSADSLAPSIDVTLTQVPTSATVIIFSSTDLLAASLTSMAQVCLLGRAETLVQDAAAGGGPNTYNGDFENTAEIPQINAKILSTIVNSQTKKLKTVWTPELSQDLNAYMALDAEVELTNILSEQIATEIDREIIFDLLGVAAVKAAWSRRIGRYLYFDTNTNTVKDASANGSTFSSQAFYGTQDDWHNTLGHVTLAVSNNIYKRNLKFGANWIITGMQVSTILESMGERLFAASDDATTGGESQKQYSMGIEKVGSLQNRWTVYKDPYFPEAKMLLGYKGKSQLEAGYIWCPYIPLIVTPTIFSPDNFNPIKGVMTRNGKTTIRPDFYGTIDVYDLNFYTF